MISLATRITRPARAGMSGPSPGLGRQATSDETLPGLAAALDPAVVSAQLAAQGALSTATALAIRYVRYHPGRGAWITYESSSGQLLYGRLAAPGEEMLAGHERDERNTPGSRGRAGAAPAPVFLPELSMVVRFFPHDATLRRLAEVCHLPRLKHQLLSALAAEEGAGNWKIKAAAVEMTGVRYKPERRFVFRLHVRGRERTSGRKRELGFYGQVDADGTGERVAPVLAALAARAGQQGPLAVPRPMLHDPELGLLLVEEIAGTPLIDHLERDDAKKVMRRLASRLADIQRADVRPRVTRGIPEQLDAVAAAAAFIGMTARAGGAGLARQASTLVGELRSRAPAGSPVSLIHGDFHAGQVLVRGRRTWIVDFDRAALGDPLADLGTFVAGLHTDVLEGQLGREVARRATKIFLRGHAEAWPEAQDKSRLVWQVAAALLEMSVAPLRQLRSGWPDLVRGRLDLAANALRTGEVLP